MIGSKSKWITHAEVEAEFDSLHLPKGWTQEPDDKKADKYFRKYSKCRRKIYRRHLATLSHDERKMLKAGEHPSQSHDRADAAWEYAHELHRELEQRGIRFVREMKLGFYHCDRLLLTMIVAHCTNEQEARTLLPFYFHGFETRWWSEKT